MRCFLLSCLLAICVNSFAQPAIRFQKNKIKSQEVKAGKTLSFDFFFKNSGDQPLSIKNIEVSCSCTTFKFPTNPVLPGQQDVIHVTFDTSNKIGWQYRSLIVHSNAKSSPDKIQFVVKVIP